ncbi:MAG: copper homeostasis protein CutC [Gemmatimonadetes bacterium]|nr:MAG: copper homeostasis protein CutC [Gemmatimonadota bacterium]
MLVEACVDSVTGALAAAAGGAGRLELCTGLVEGGLTPSTGLVAAVRERVAAPVHVLIRPRGGDFLYDADDITVMLRDIAGAKRLGVAGVVLGALTAGGRVDVEHTRFDALMALGIERVLTSGQAASAEAGMSVIAAMVAQSVGRIAVMAGGGINQGNVARIVRETGVGEIHVRGSRITESGMAFRRAGVLMGKRYEPDEYRRLETDPVLVRGIVAAVNGW